MENDDLMYSELSESEEHTWALFSHLGMIAGKVIPFSNIVVPLVIWQINKDKSEYVADHALEALNFQITISIIYAVALVLCAIVIGIPILIFAGLVDVICSILGAIKAAKGEYYDYPVNFRFIKQ